MSRTTRAFAALAAAVALVPAGATAAEAKAPKPKAKTVATHLVRAQAALDDVKSAVRSGDAAEAKAAVKAARRDATYAARKARTLAAGGAITPQAIASLAGAAGQYGQAMATFADLIPAATADLQAVLANAIPGSVAGRQQLLDLLTSLTTRLTGDAQALAAKALAALQQQAPTQTAELADAAQVATLPAGISALLDHALATATAMLDDGLAVLNGVLGELPAAVQAPIQAVLTSVTSVIPTVLDTVSTIVPSVLGLVDGILQTVTGLVPSAGAPSTPATGTTPSTAPSGLLGGLTNLIPGFGKLFGGLLGAPRA